MWLQKNGGDPCGIDPYPAAVSSEHVERQERRDSCSSEISEEQLLTKPAKNPKPNKKVDHDQDRAARVQRKSYDRVPEHRDSHASSSRELSLEPTPARSGGFG